MNLHRLDLVSLSLFNLVVRSGSISKGAELAHLAVGAASKRISDLEDAVGAELLERHSRGVTLTLAGQALQRHAQRILADVDLLAADLSDHAAGIVGVVRLWANTSATTQFLPADLAGFIAAHPGIRIEMYEKDSSDAVLAVLDGRCACASTCAASTRCARWSRRGWASRCCPTPPCSPTCARWG
jgi:DNA-binding transcriptional LysR family regulator